MDPIKRDEVGGVSGNLAGRDEVSILRAVKVRIEQELRIYNEAILACGEECKAYCAKHKPIEVGSGEPLEVATTRQDEVVALRESNALVESERRVCYAAIKACGKSCKTYCIEHVSEREGSK